MKFTKLVVVIAILMAFVMRLRADEGMWLPILLNKNYAEMQKLGLKLTPEQLYDINNASLKDAIVMLDHGSCTGEIISEEGLLLTNHHCGYGEIQAHSTEEHDYLTDGFWAFSKEEELPNPGKTASFLIKIEDVTAKVLADVNDDMTERERASQIAKVSKELMASATEGNHYEAKVKSMFNGNQYFLFVYETFKDVRLVGAPPSSIGKFGGDTDNWMWPRHTGDFSIFRVYCAPDGTPAEYSDENVPYKPKHVLPISLNGIENGDFAMIFGYPGSTDRYLTSYGIKLALDQVNPGIVKIRDKKLSILRQDMNASDKVRIQYASKYAQTANYWKYYQGQSKGLKDLNVYEKKQALEKRFQDWVDADKSRKAKYGSVLNDFESAYKVITDNKYELAMSYINELLGGAEILYFAWLNGMELVPAIENDLLNDESKKALLEDAKEHFKDYNTSTDKKLLAAMLEIFYSDLPANVQDETYEYIQKKCKGDYMKYAEKVFKKSIFTSYENFENFLNDPKLKDLQNDLAYKAPTAIIEKFRDYYAGAHEANAKLEKANRLFLAGLLEMDKDKNFYPDANSTMRCTYGTVQDYKPRDGVTYNLLTTLSGVMEKENPESHEFKVHKKLKELYAKKDFGQYGMTDEKGEKIMPVCFLTTNDITGGNSGSPVINGNGELIGTAFDGNWEAMSGDIAFEKSIQRTIVCDIRYVLFVIDKFAGAKNLIKEMKIQ